MYHTEEYSCVEPGERAKTILVVEDDEDIGMLLVRAISLATTYKAMLVADGFQALEAVRRLKPNLFLLDYHLPSMNGIELYDRLHTVEGLEHVPAIMISASLPTDELQKRKLIGMNKPLKLRELFHTIETLLISR